MNQAQELLSRYWPTIAPLVWYAIGSGLLNLAARRSQVDAWCNKRPRLAATLKFARAIGFDPWLIVQAVALAARGRLPLALTAIATPAPAEAEPPSPPAEGT